MCHRHLYNLEIAAVISRASSVSEANGPLFARSVSSMIAARPAQTRLPDVELHKRALPALFSQAGRLVLLLAAGVVMQIGWSMVWVLSYRLTHGNDFTYQLLVGNPPLWERLYRLLVLANTLAPGIEPPQTLDILVNALVLGFVVASIGYLAAIFLLDLGISAVRGALAIVVGVEVFSQVFLFLLPGLFTTDIFSYVMYGHISANYGLNPYIFPPAYFPANPMLGWIHPIWHNTPSVYGPLWTDLGWAVAWIITPLSQVDQVLVYKALMNGVHLLNLGLIWWLLGRFAPSGGSHRARLVAFTLFAWNPLVLFDVAGNAHNDALMVTLLLLSLVPLAHSLKTRTSPAAERAAVFDTVRRTRRIAHRRWLLALLGIALSALIKYTAALVGLFFVVAWSRQLRSLRARILWIGSAGLLALALAIAVAWPWLRLPQVLNPILNAAGGTLYTNSVPDLLALTIADRLIDPSGLNLVATRDSARFWMKLVTRVIFAGYLVWECRKVWRTAGLDDPRCLAQEMAASSARAFLVLLVLVFTWVLEWYFIWPLALATLLGWRRLLTVVAVAYTLTALPIFYVHHYWSVLMPGVWIDVYAGLPLVLPVLWYGRSLFAGVLDPVREWRSQPH